MIGCGFEGTDGNSLNVQNFASGMPETDDDTQCAIIQVWTGSKLEPYTYMAYDYDVNDNLISGWLDASGDPVDFDTPPGFSCWFKCPSAMTLTISGQVVPTDKKSIDIAANTWQLVANPYPESTKLNDGALDASGLPQTDDDTQCAVIQFWTGSKLEPYTYMAYDFDADDNLLCAWLDASGDPVDLTIPAQTGFWIKSPTAGTIVWSK